jgi:hypothetical protein
VITAVLIGVGLSLLFVAALGVGMRWDENR